jgi:hypothetical protein
MLDEPQEDFLGLSDPDQVRAEQGPALMVGATCGGHELRMLDQMRREPGEEFRDHWRITFTDENDQWEAYDGRSKIEHQQPEIWRVRMGWPVGTVPTPADAMQWIDHRRARLIVKWAPRLTWARDQDEKAARGEAEPVVGDPGNGRLTSGLLMAFGARYI